MKYKLHFNLNKALDVDQDKLLAIVKQFLNDKGYVLYDLSGGDRDAFDAAWKFKKDYSTGFIQYFISPKNMTLFKQETSKDNPNRGFYYIPSPEEKKFFDSLGFTLEPAVSKATNNDSLDAWFNLKANDDLSFEQWSKKIVEFLKSQDYEIDKVQEYQPFKGRSDLGYIKATKEKHMKNLQTGQTKVSPVEITVDREHNYVKLQRRLNVLYFPEKLTNEELKFFDGMGLDLYEDNIKEQNIDDWFKVGESK